MLRGLNFEILVRCQVSKNSTVRVLSERHGQKFINKQRTLTQITVNEAVIKNVSLLRLPMEGSMEATIIPHTSPTVYKLVGRCFANITQVDVSQTSHGLVSFPVVCGYGCHM